MTPDLDAARAFASAELDARIQAGEMLSMSDRIAALIRAGAQHCFDQGRASVLTCIGSAELELIHYAADSLDVFHDHERADRLREFGDKLRALAGKAAL